MEKRRIVFGTYDTAETGLWTLASWSLSPAEYQSAFISVPGRSGDLDLSAVLTDGEPRYKSRTLTAVLESSEGSRLDRKSRTDTMVNWLDGWRMNITLPDDPDHFITGRVHVAPEYNDLAHCAVKVTAICDPWRYFNEERAVSFSATSTSKSGTLPNLGRLTVVPTLEISGNGASVNLAAGSSSWALGPGVYQLPDLIVRQGGRAITYSGTGTLTFTYREAVL